MTDFEARTELHNADNPYPGASEHGPNKIMTSDEIIAMKQELLGDIGELDSRLCRLARFIVLDMLMEAYEKDAQQRADPTISYGSNVPQELQGRVSQASFLGAHWAIGILQACQLPNDEWPLEMSPPVDFALWLKDMDEAEALAPDGIEATAGITVSE